MQLAARPPVPPAFEMALEEVGRRLLVQIPENDHVASHLYGLGYKIY